MKKPNKNPKTAEELREEAEKKLFRIPKETELHASDYEHARLVQELQIHQIELEMQNDELILANERAKAAEKRFKDLYDFAPSSYLSVSQGGEVLELNLAAAKLLNKKREHILNSHFALFIELDSLSTFNGFFENIFAKLDNQSCDLQLNTDSAFVNRVSLLGVLSADNICQITMVDITERDRIKRDLIKAKQKAEESDRLKSAFLANMSHEIRTPLNGILGFSELLKNSELSTAEQQNYIGIIEKSGVRMLNIINDIISISKIEAGLMELNLTESDIIEQINYITTFFKPEAEGKGMQIHFKNPLSTGEIMVQTDREKFIAILTNLVKNAIKYSEEGQIELGYCITEKCIEFYVKDSGIGIHPDKQKAVFERFIQADITDKRAFQGAGLGLSISKAYVELLGGEIWLKSELGKGSTFYFTLPFDPKLKQQMIVEKTQKGPAQSTLSRKLKVLVADDDAICHLLMNAILKDLSSEILKATNGSEALQLFKENPDIDLILMDIQMPIMSGYDATKEIGKLNKEVVIIAQTANALRADRKKTIAVGCNDYIPKPIKRDVLLKLINTKFQ